MASSLFDTAGPDKSLVDRKTIDGSVYLMRHGHTMLDVDRRSDGWLDLPLSDDGRLGVIPAQQYLKTIPLVCVHCPDLKRAHETAHIVASGTMSEPKVLKDDDLRTWNLGVLAGTRKRYGRPEVQKLINDPSKAPLGGESFNNFRDRFMPAFMEIADECVETGKPCLYVGSGSNLRLIGQQLFGDPDMLDLDEGGLAILHSSNGTWHVEIILGEDDNGDQVS